MQKFLAILLLLLLCPVSCASPGREEADPTPALTVESIRPALETYLRARNGIWFDWERDEQGDPIFYESDGTRDNARFPMYVHARDVQTLDQLRASLALLDASVYEPMLAQAQFVQLESGLYLSYMPAPQSTLNMAAAQIDGDVVTVPIITEGTAQTLCVQTDGFSRILAVS